MQVLTRRTGVEVELLAPPGSDRLVLAAEIADRCGGHVRRMFHTDSEPSLVPGMGHFWHMTPAFAVHDADGALRATLVDDITLVADLVRERASSRPAGSPASLPELPSRLTPDDDWYRILCDEPRLLRLIDDHSDPSAPFPEALDMVATLFGTAVETIGGVRRLRDAAGATVALAAPLPPGRERPCEVVTPPLTSDHHRALEALLAPARELGFTVPAEAAVHLHLDAGPFRSVAALTNLVRLFGHWRGHLRTALGTNPACTRLQPLPEALLALADPDEASSAPARSSWARFQQAAAATGITKYYDVNLTALLTDAPRRDTVEVRILPGALHAEDVTSRAALLEELLERCLHPRPLPRPTTDAATDPRGAVRELRSLGARMTPAAVTAGTAGAIGARGEG